MSKCCNTCVFYKQKTESYSCGTCDYPVPEWIRNGTSGGGFISKEEYAGADCATYKSREDIINDERNVTEQLTPEKK